jgi:hypothetical protein
MKYSFLLLLMMLSVSIGTVCAQKTKPIIRQVVEAPLNKQKFHLYLLIGQSNMAGRGVVEPQDTLPNRKVLRLNEKNQWEIAKDPVHFDKSVAGVGPGLTFGKIMADQDTTVTIGLIPCAVGGSGIDFWKEGAFYNATKTYPYDNAIGRTKEAMRSGTIKGIIWHQGESDSNPAKSIVYGQKLKQLIEALRGDLYAPLLPFVAGQLPDYQIEKKDSLGVEHVNSAAVAVNKAIADLQIGNYAFISAKNTSDIGDHTHFTASSARLMGRRYAEAMIKLNKQ